MLNRRISRRVVAAGAVGGGVLSGGEAAGVAVDRMEDELVAEQSRQALWPRWTALWNGDLAIADEIIAPGFVAHFAPMGASPSEVRGPDGLRAWIGEVTAAFADYRFTTIVGPLAEGDLVAGRWVFTGTYQGGVPGAPAGAAGREVEYAGTDLYRVDDGLIVEYWLSADTLQLLQQLGVIPA